jgi:hypothetical protein
VRSLFNRPPGELNGIQQYITDNPAKWEEDENHPTKWKVEISLA